MIPKKMRAKSAGFIIGAMILGFLSGMAVASWLHELSTSRINTAFSVPVNEGTNFVMVTLPAGIYYVLISKEAHPLWARSYSGNNAAPGTTKQITIHHAGIVKAGVENENYLRFAVPKGQRGVINVSAVVAGSGYMSIGSSK